MPNLLPQPTLDRAQTTAYIGLGANLGQAVAAVLGAAQALANLPGTRLCQVSGLYGSSPVDAAGPDFVNAVAKVATRLVPLDLLHALQALEADHGRERPYKNAPRTLDLDLLLYGQHTQATPELSLPHPRLHLRRFVLAPLAEIAPALNVPGFGAVAPLLAATAGQAVWRISALGSGLKE